jgi:tRNA(Ile)-lysidine synthase
MSRLADIARETVARHELLPADTPCVVLVSGGADSTALLRLLADGEFGERPLLVLHIDHMLREGSASDAEWVESICREWRIPCRVRREDVPSLAEREGLNVEDAGRQVRYRLAGEAADELARETGWDASAVRVATAHTRDDLAETVLMRLATGAGPGALAGIRARRGRIVRPLIDARRTDIVGYLESLSQDWLEDPTNRDTSRLRARVRHDLVPVFEDINPSFVDALARSAALLAEDDDMLQELASAFARDFEIAGAEDCRDVLELDAALLATLSTPMARRVLRTAIVDRFPEASRLEHEHVDAIVRAMGGEAVARDVTGGLRVSVGRDRIVVSRACEEPDEWEEEILVPGTTEFDGGRLDAQLLDAWTIGDEPNVAVLDAGTLSGPLRAGSAREGERIRPLGMEGTKKVSDLLSEARIPRLKRRTVPVVRDGDAVVWVAGVRLSEDYKVTPDSRRAIRLIWQEDRGRTDRRRTEGHRT